MNYINLNSNIIDRWIEDGWEWGKPVSHQDFINAKDGQWNVLLTPTKFVPKNWFPSFKDCKILGLASGGGQQMPIFTALGAKCTVMDYSQKQIESENEVADREGYNIETVRADMTQPFPFESETFDLIFHPVSNCYIENVLPVWKESFRVLKRGGILLAGFDNGVNYILDNTETFLKHKLPFNPLKDKEIYQECIQEDYGIQFSHTLEEQLGGLLKTGFTLCDLYEDTNGTGKLHEFNVPTYLAVKAKK